MKRRNVLLQLSGLALAAPALAEDSGLLAQWRLLSRPAGAARMTFWGMAIYDATLWIAEDFRASRYADHAFALQLSYLRSLKGADIARRSIEEMQRIASLEPQKAQRWEAGMRTAFRDVAKGDRLTGVHRPGKPVLFLANGQPSGEIDDPEFGHRFFGIWLAPTTSEPALRQALLAGAAQ